MSPIAPYCARRFIAFLLIAVWQTTPLLSRPATAAGDSPPRGCFAKVVSIKEPVGDHDRPANIQDRAMITGTVNPGCARVVVVIHPLAVSNYYVQPIPTIGGTGKWQVLAYFGESGRHFGEVFEIRAFANPRKKFREGEIFGDWPEAQAASDVVVATKMRSPKGEQ